MVSSSISQTNLVQKHLFSVSVSSPRCRRAEGRLWESLRQDSSGREARSFLESQAFASCHRCCHLEPRGPFLTYEGLVRELLHLSCCHVLFLPSPSFAASVSKLRFHPTHSQLSAVPQPAPPFPGPQPRRAGGSTVPYHQACGSGARVSLCLLCLLRSATSSVKQLGVSEFVYLCDVRRTMVPRLNCFFVTFVCFMALSKSLRQPPPGGQLAQHAQGRTPRSVRIHTGSGEGPGSPRRRRKRFRVPRLAR